MSTLSDPDVFRNILENLQTGVYVVDRDQKILFWNAGAERITGFLRQDVVGRFCRENLFASKDKTDSFAKEAAAAIEAVLRDGKAMTINVSLRHKEGHRVLVRARAVPIRNSHGSVIAAAESFEESISVSMWDRRHERLSKYGCLDDETGTLNNSFIRLQLKELMQTYSEFKVPFSVICARIDHIDDLKSTYGHKAVGAILRAVAQSVGNSLRPTDFWGRLDDRDFLAILPECNVQDVDKVGQRLKKAVGMAEIRWWGDNLSVTASFGGTTIRAGDTEESLLERAERALIESATHGGNCVSLLVE
jgi:diguanylate cyclase (GGDEF)-like protein/PAS domain S-box-containing protein